MRGCTFFLACALFSAGSLQAQGTVVRPEVPLDPARAELRDALLGLRDSLTSIDAAASRLQRDFRQASGPSLLSRARVMGDACARSARTIPPTRSVVVAANAPDERRLKRKGELTRALDQLSGVLTHCDAEFSAMSQPGKAETVRGYANDRAVRVQGALRKYEKTLGEFLGAMGIKVAPLGAEARPVAG